MLFFQDIMKRVNWYTNVHFQSAIDSEILNLGDVFASFARPSHYNTFLCFQRYTLNYHKLKEGGAFGASRGHTKGILHEQDKPDTVVGNVKNVQGWRSGAERGFLGCYTDIIHQVGSNQQFPELTMWYTKVQNLNLINDPGLLKWLFYLKV